MIPDFICALPLRVCVLVDLGQSVHSPGPGFITPLLEGRGVETVSVGTKKQTARKVKARYIPKQDPFSPSGPMKVSQKDKYKTETNYVLMCFFTKGVHFSEKSEVNQAKVYPDTTRT